MHYLGVFALSLFWFPFSGTVGRVALMVASIAYLLGLGVASIRRGALVIALAAAAAAVLLAYGWSARMAAVAIGVSCALLLVGRYPTEVPDAPDDSGPG